MNKYEQLKILALKINNVIMELSIETKINPENIAIKLPNDYWMEMLLDLKPNDSFYLFHPESTYNKFKLCNITFYNDKSMPEWMKI